MSSGKLTKKQEQQNLTKMPSKPISNEQPQTQKPIQRTFLFLINGLETQNEKVIIVAPNIMLATLKFGQQFHDYCMDWTTMSLLVEEIDVLQ